MRSKGWYLLWLLPLSLLADDRDPFLPPEDRCQTAQLAQWHYGGAVGNPQRWVGLLRDPGGKWRRVRGGESLPAGWRIRQLTTEKIEITTGPECEPLHWAWLRAEGDKNGAMDKPAVSAAWAGHGGKK
ncbi:pilus assembly protein HofP [Raoultella sp. BIGb0138]|uniref:HofP DNA utilization family protein n=1 Tax=Raoultella sp. BIGb0138 TaxID=2485115 RepID=UPI0010487621|nr:HofP DNA utilization family protein [Raoultella sp. BIGb0138]TCW06033.1 pilus assembly protein HofP [Raoultella sp. BIGb0138]